MTTPPPAPASPASPFRPGYPVTGDKFYGRRKECDRILQSDQWVWLCGPRRMGKTSLLRQVGARINKEGGVALGLDLQLFSGNPLTGRKLVKELLLDSSNRELIEAKGVRIPPASQADATELLGTVVKRLLESASSVVILWDEAETLGTLAAEDPGFLGRLAARLVGQERVRLVIASSQRLAHLFPQAPDFYHAFRWVPLAGLEEEASRDLLRCTQTGGWRSPLADDLLAQATEWCGGHPFVLHHLGAALSDQYAWQGSRVMARTIEEAKRRWVGLDTNRATMDDDFSRLTPEQQDLLRSVCGQTAPVPLEDLKRQLGLADLEFSSALSFLESYGYVVAAEETVRLGYPFYRQVLPAKPSGGAADTSLVDGLRRTIFVSYSHVDRPACELLRSSLNPLLRGRQIELWDDSKLRAGQQWQEEIEAALKRAQVAVLLISQSFLNSEFIANNELPKLLARARGGGCAILCLHVGPSNFEHVVWQAGDASVCLADFQALNPPERTLADLKRLDQVRTTNEAAISILRILQGGR